MRTTIDSAGRIVIPKQIREQAGFAPGTEIDVTYCDGRVSVEAAPGNIRLERRGPFVVAVFDGIMPPFPADLAERTLEEIRNERGMVDIGDDKL